MFILLISFFMVTKTTTLAPPSLSAVLKSNTIQSAPASTSPSSSATADSNAAKLAAIKAANQVKSNTPEVFTVTANAPEPTNVVL